MTDPQSAETERRQAIWGFLIALAVVVVLVLAFVLFGLPGAGMTMVVVTPIMFVILITLSVGK